MGETRHDFIADVALTGAGAVPLGQKTAVDLVADNPTEHVTIRHRMDLSIAGGAADGTIRNRGSILATVRAYEFEDGSEIKSRIDARVLKVANEAMAPRALSDFARLAGGGVQANTLLYEAARFAFGLPILAVPRETYYIAHKNKAPQNPKLRLLIETVPDVRAALSSGSDRVYTVNSFSAEITQKMDPLDRTPPYFVPIYQQVSAYELPGAVRDKGIPIYATDRIAALIVQQTAADYEVGDIIDDLEIRSDRRVIVQKTTARVLNIEEQYRYGGGVPITGYHIFTFIDGGKWGNALEPAKEPNLRLVFNADALSAVVGTNQVRVWAVLLREVAGITRSLSAAAA